MTEIDVQRLRRIAKQAQNTYVGRHWPTMEDMRVDGIGYGLVEDRKHDPYIRRYIETFQPEFLVDLLARYEALVARSAVFAAVPDATTASDDSR